MGRAEDGFLGREIDESGKLHSGEECNQGPKAEENCLQVQSILQELKRWRGTDYKQRSPAAHQERQSAGFRIWL